MSTMNCCDPSMSLLDQIFSDSCQWCSEGSYTLQQQEVQQFGGNAGVPNCDPNSGIFSNLFSNSCNVSVSDLPSEVLGLPSGIPSWVLWGVIVVGGVFVFKEMR